ncbi:MAG TPA: NAD(P)-dependent oxidoreductase [Candidatus Salinicoccus merdavium]|nr:NAD(P)-dependent oxidoreductase [Candidatus Salinicoccus merdavium]
MNIGLIGCGAMGQGIARNLLKAGHNVLIHDDMSKSRELLEGEGAEFVEIKTISANVDHLFLSLPSTQILENALLGDDVLSSLPKGAMIFDLGTTDVETTRMIHEKAEETGVYYLDCPVSGGPAGAESGTLTILVGGSDDIFPEARAILENVGEKIVHVGGSGTGQAVKLCNNMIVAGITALLSETMVTANNYGVSNKQLANIIQQSSGQNKVLDVFGENLINEKFDNILFFLGHMSKDLELYMNLSKESKTPQFVSSIVSQLYRTALKQGKGTLDSTAVYSVISE